MSIDGRATKPTPPVAFRGPENDFVGINSRMALSATEYHRQTSYSRTNMRGHGLDWSNQPHVFKVYPGFPTVPLSVPDISRRPGPYLSQLVRKTVPADSSPQMDFERLMSLIGLTHVVTAKSRHGREDFYYRSVASAGALYPFELYAGVAGVRGIDDGIYHHTLGLNALTRLRDGDINALLSGEVTGLTEPPALAFFFTSIFFRSAWKYGDRNAVLI